jgi:hypothetical protein
MNTQRKSDTLLYIIAIICGLIAGILHVLIQDPLITALIVLASTMVLGFLRPERAWRWTLFVGLVVPIVMFVAWKTGHFSNFTRAALFGSSLVILPGFAGAYGGFFGNLVLKEIFAKEKPSRESQ